MKTILLSLLAILFIGCNVPDTPSEKIPFTSYVDYVDGCKYVVFTNHSNGSVSGVHAGDCINSKHFSLIE